LLKTGCEFERQPGGGDRRLKAAALRAARERSERIAEAQKELADINEQRRKNGVKPKTKEARASTTDPQARRMKMGDGGFVVQAGGDQGQMSPMHTQVREDYGVTPKDYLVDGGFSVKEQIVSVTRAGSTVYGVITNAEKQLAEGKNPYAAKPRDAPEMAAFRERMGTQAAKEKYSQRAGIAEFPNAECRNRGLTQFRVRGLIKARAQMLWHVLAHNFNRMRHLGYLETVMAT